jgi:hypothetical protein
MDKRKFFSTYLICRHLKKSFIKKLINTPNLKKTMSQNPLLSDVHLGTMIVVENTLFKVVKKYNDFVWRLKSENGEIINLFYALSQSWSLHCT